MITDEQFIAAMERVVKEKGEFHSAPPMYWTRANGATCIIGVALDAINPAYVPHDNRHMAISLLPMLGCSQRVALAAMVAQALNDHGAPWGMVLETFHEALAMWRKGIPEQAYMEFGHRKIVRFIMAGNPIPMPKFEPKKVTITGASITGAFSTATITFTSLTSAFENLNVILADANKVGEKKDHALVA